MKSATPGVGKVTFGEGFRIKGHDHEIEIGNWLLNTFGGKIELLGENSIDKTPDYKWNEKLWELKSVSSQRNLQKLFKKGIEQIKADPGGIVFDFCNNELSVEIALQHMALRRKSVYTGTVLIFKSGTDILEIIKI